MESAVSEKWLRWCEGLLADPIIEKPLPNQHISKYPRILRSPKICVPLSVWLCANP